jgi:hypothetical protein
LSRRRLELLKRRWLVLVLCVLAAFVAVGVAGAADTGILLDPVGDSGSAPDITRVEIDEYSYPPPLDETLIEFTVTFAGELRCTSDGDGVPMVVAVDTDQNPDTGSAFYGTEFELAPDEIGDAMFFRAQEWDFRAAPYPEGLGWGCGPREASYGISGSALGLAPGAGFNVAVAVIGPHTDTAPDIRTFNYQPVAGRRPPPLGADRRPPHLIAYSTDARRGKVAQLRFWALDGRGRTAEVVRIYKKTRLLKTIRRPLHDSNPFVVSHVDWRVPKSLRGRLRYSVDAVDAAGNHSKRRWAWVVIR